MMVAVAAQVEWTEAVEQGKAVVGIDLEDNKKEVDHLIKNKIKICYTIFLPLKFPWIKFGCWIAGWNCSGCYNMY